MRTVKLLALGYLGLSVLTLVAIVLMRDDPAEVNDVVWTRGTIVVLAALLTLWFTSGAAKGQRRAYLRLRITSAIMVVAIAVLVSLPGLLPLWMRIEQGVCGLLLLGVVLIINARRVRQLYIRT
ncbi:hypothetical protein [Actinocrispum sp. NPDC049592]|uniref:hypothetical protein n=1 Tax=Actinocrispum sp. NPDC049592 TaxID=3154835 RepID=UPI0034383D9D